MLLSLKKKDLLAVNVKIQEVYKHRIYFAGIKYGGLKYSGKIQYILQGCSIRWAPLHDFNLETIGIVLKVTL